MEVVEKRASASELLLRTSFFSGGRRTSTSRFRETTAERMRTRGARLGLDMAGLAITRHVTATACPFVAHEGSTFAGTRAPAKRARLDRRSRCRGHRDDHGRRFSTRAASTSSPDDGRAFGTLGAPGPGEGSAHQIAALVVWLKRHGVDFSDRARFVRVRGMGVGGVATRDLRQGDAVFSLPLFGATPGESLGVPLVITTAVVMDQKGPLGRLARALAASGLVASRRGGGDSSASVPTHRLGGVRESDHEFPLHVSAASLLALALLFQSAKSTSRDGGEAHWATYVDLLPRETDALLEWSDEDLSRLKGSRHVARALERRALVDGVHEEVFPALHAVDPGLFSTRVEEEHAAEDEADENASADFDRGARFETSAFASKRAFRWAFATVLARAFELPSEVRGIRERGETTTPRPNVDTREKEFGLCPGLDLFNHGDDAEPCVVEGLDDVFALAVRKDAEAATDPPNSDSRPRGIEPDADAALDVDASLDSDDVRYDEDEARLRSLGPRVTLRVGIGGAWSGEQLFHKYADEADGGSVLEFGFARLGGGGARAADCDFSSLLRRHAPEKRAERLAYLATLGLCRGATYEVTDARRMSDETSDEPERARVGVACVPGDAARVARVLTLDDSEFDAVRAWDDEDAGAYDGTCAFGAAHQRRYATAMAALFEKERDALHVPMIPQDVPFDSRNGERHAVADDDASRARRARREEMARRVHEGEVSLLEEIARDFQRLARDREA